MSVFLWQGWLDLCLRGSLFWWRGLRREGFRWWWIAQGKLFWVEITGSCLVVAPFYSLCVWRPSWACNFRSVKIIGHRVSLQRCATSICLWVFDCGLFLRRISDANIQKRDHFLWKVLVCEMGFYCWSSKGCILLYYSGQMTRWWILPDVTYLTPYLSRRTCWDDAVFRKFLDIYFYGFIFSINFHFFNIYKHSSFILLEQKYNKPTSNFLFVVEMFTWLAVLL